MFTLVVTQQFEEFYFKPDNPITSFNDIAEIFRKHWILFTNKNKGKKIKETMLVDFFSFLRTPLGYKYTNAESMSDGDDFNNIDTKNIPTIIKRQEIAKQIWKMDLPVDLNGYVPFGAVLHAALKNAYGKKFLVDVEKDAYRIIRRMEVQCLANIMQKNYLSENKSRFSRFKKNKVSDGKDDYLENIANPFALLLFVQMSFLSWKKLTEEYIILLREAKVSHLDNENK